MADCVDCGRSLRETHDCVANLKHERDQYKLAWESEVADQDVALAALRSERDEARAEAETLRCHQIDSCAYQEMLSASCAAYRLALDKINDCYYSNKPFEYHSSAIRLLSERALEQDAGASLLKRLEAAEAYIAHLELELSIDSDEDCCGDLRKAWQTLKEAEHG